MGEIENNTQQTPSVENAAFWLPSHFLTDQDFLLHDPTPIPLPIPDPFDSPLTSPDTTDHFLSDLTRHLAHSSLLETHQKPWSKISTSPQSTLTGFEPRKSNRSGFTSNGSPNGPSLLPSPPLTPSHIKDDAAWDLLYQAAGQMARLKINALSPHLTHHSSRGILGAPRHHHPNCDFPQQEVKRQGVWAQQEREIWPRCNTHHHHQESRGWPGLAPRQHQQRQVERGVQARGMCVGGGGGAKRQSTGTGVFLPRRVTAQHHHAEPPPLKKPTGCSPVLLSTPVVQALNNNLDDNLHSRFGYGFSDHEVMMARRNAILNQQRRNMRTENAAAAAMVGHDIRLPTDWTY